MAGTYSQKPWADGISSVTAIEMDGITATVGTPSIIIKMVDSSGNVTYAGGATVPTNGDAGYAVGCFFKKSTGGSGTTLYINEGSATSAAFNAVETSAAGLTLPFAGTDAATTTGNSLAITASALTTGNVFDAIGPGAGLTTGSMFNAAMGAAVTGSAFSGTTSGVYTGAGLLQLTANSATTGTLVAVSGTGLTTGSGVVVTGSGATFTTGSLFTATMGAALTGAAFTASTTGVYTGAGLLQLTANSATTGTIAAITGTGLTSGPALSLAGPSSALFVAGLNGATNPAFKIDASTASSATGFSIKSNAANGTVQLITISSSSNESLSIDAKGTGYIALGTVSTGNVLIPRLYAAYNTAPPAGGSAAAQLMFSSTANLGLYFGSGAPTVSAAQGSLYVRTDGSSTSTRLYVNTTGSTTWTNVTTAA